MNSKLIAVAGGTFGLGALIGWAVTADRYERNLKDTKTAYDKVVLEQDSHIQKLKLDLEFKDPRTPEPTEENLLEGMEPENSPEGSPDETVYTSDDDLRGETEEETRSNLQGLIDRYTANEDDVATFTTRAARTIDSDYIPPSVISQATYSWDEEGEHYAKITLKWFPREQILLDDDDELIEDVDLYVGFNNLRQFGGESGDPDVVFVRNPGLMTDFEVVKDDEGEVPIHIRYSMSKDEFEVNRRAGVIKFRPGDE